MYVPTGSAALAIVSCTSNGGSCVVLLGAETRLRMEGSETFEFLLLTAIETSETLRSTVTEPVTESLIKTDALGCLLIAEIELPCRLTLISPSRLDCLLILDGAVIGSSLVSLDMFRGSFDYATAYYKGRL